MLVTKTVFYALASASLLVTAINAKVNIQIYPPFNFNFVIIGQTKRGQTIDLMGTIIQDLLDLFSDI